ncbi:MAG: hypothetical protein JNL98_20365 [Bryobacterales bacterium]|nr:hypothetical protein [Bryobacterales bacterium]
MRPIPVAITIAVAAIVIQILGPSPSGQAARPPGTASTKESGVSAVEEDSKDDPVRKLMSASIGKGPNHKFNHDEVNSHYSIYLVLAPDPGKTRLGLYFDRWIDSVQLAVEHSGYRFDTHWLPWQVPGAQAAGADKNQAERLKHPGILLFRRSDGCNPRIAVLVVGENPAHGVDRDQMQWILSSGLDIAGVVGPSFSGSFDSLIETFAGKHDLRNNLRIMSGTATNPDAIARFRTHFPRFETVIRDDGAALGALKAYLSRHTLTTTTLAILTESGTAYGQQFRAQRTRNGKLRTLSVQFPREISAIRNAYQEDSSLSGGRAQASPEDIVLRLQLRDPHRGGDTVPLLGGLASAVTQESVLIHIAATLREERADYVAIAATSVLDVLFLARFVRKICPDTRLVFLENDALFVRPPDSSSFIGSLAVSSYSLIVRNQLWIRPGSEWLVPFPSSSTEGVYNAMLALIDNTPLADYYPPGEFGMHPPVWITMSGRDRYWPVASYSKPAPEPLRAAPPQFTAIQISNPGNLWIAMYGSLVLTAIWFATCTRIAARLPNRRVDIASFFLPQASSPKAADQGRAYYHMLMLFALIGMMMILCGPVIAAAGNSGIFMRILAAASAVLIAWLAVEAARIYRRHLWRGSDSRYLSITVFCFLLLGLFLWFASLARSKDQEGLFLALRSLEPSSGVSPVVPLLLASLGFVCWCWVHWQRMILFCERSIELPAEPFPDIAQRAVRICEFLGRPYQLTDPVVLSVTLGIFALVCLVLDSFENRTLDLLFRQMAGGICGLLAVNFVMFFRLWRTLRDVLNRLELLPFREAFSNIPEQLGRTALWVNNPYRPSYALLVRAEETLRALAAKEPSYLYDLPARATEFSGAVKGLIESEARSIRPSADDQRRAREMSRDLAAQLSAKLRYYWRERDYWRDRAGESSPILNRDAHTSAEHFVAIHHVMFIRSVMLGLRNYLNSFVTGFILLTLALNAYPFQSAGRIRWMITAIFVTIGGGLVISMVQMDHNPILSRLTKTKPSEFDPQFWYKVATIGILPLLTAVGSQFPELTRLIVSWVQPAISALK